MSGHPTGQSFRIKLIDAALIAEADALVGRRGVKVLTCLLGHWGVQCAMDVA